MLLSGFGAFAGAVGLAMCVWFIHIGFLMKKILKESQETNRLLRQIGESGSGISAGAKVA